MVFLLFIKHHWRVCLCVPIVVYVMIVIKGLSDHRLTPRFMTVARNATDTREEEIKNKNASKVFKSEKVKRANLEDDIGFGAQHLVTMFTTVKERECRKEIHNRTLRNWAALRPYLAPVLFVPTHELNSSKWMPLAASRGWDVHETKDLRKKVPILAPMFKKIIHQTTTPFVGYANADILFDHSLIWTLKRLTEIIDVTNTTLLIVGRRTNANITKFDLGSGANLTKITNMRDLMKRFHGMAQDYFIISRRGLPWHEIPDFVVGRNGYDNWLVVKGQDWNISLIDASKSILAVHQVGIDGISSGFHTNKDGTVGMNWQLVRGFKYGRGRTECAPLYTEPGCTGIGIKTKCNNMRNITLERRPLHPFKQLNRVTMRAIC